MDPDRRNRVLRQLATLHDEAARRNDVLKRDLAKLCLALKLQRARRAQLAKRRAREEVAEIIEQRRIAAEEIAAIIEQAAPPLPIEIRVENIEIRVANIEESVESMYNRQYNLALFAAIITGGIICGMTAIVRQRNARN